MNHSVMRTTKLQMVNLASYFVLEESLFQFVSVVLLMI